MLGVATLVQQLFKICGNTPLERGRYPSVRVVTQLVEPAEPVEASGAGWPALAKPGEPTEPAWPVGPAELTEPVESDVLEFNRKCVRS